jgi:DNA-binding HxlR family transcriptional regulator
MVKFPHKPVCPVEEMFRVLMGPWTMFILWNLLQGGPARYGALRRQLDGISSKVLTQRLRMLEHEGIIYRVQKPTIPPEVTYGLTDHGKELSNALGSLEALARKWHEHSKLNA